MSPADCYGHALYTNAVDWPPNGSLLAAGPLPGGGDYCVLAFDRKPVASGAVRLPRVSPVLMLMLGIDGRIARWEQGKIVVAAPGSEQKIWSGPYVNVPAGKYTVAFQIQAQGAPTAPLLALTVSDGFGKREYVTKKYRIGDLQARKAGAWASIDFVVPPASPTRVMEFVMTTYGKVPLTVSAMVLNRDE
jgi:hypothetical protein